jgi:hypothetical protein
VFAGYFMKRWQIVFLIVVMLLAMSMVIAYRVGLRLLQDRIAAALGPGSRVAELKVNWFSLDVLGVSIEAPKGWPTAHTLRAERVKIIPSLRSLLTDQIHVASIIFEKPYLSVVRTKVAHAAWPDGSWRRESRSARPLSSPTVTISGRLQDGV